MLIQTKAPSSVSASVSLSSPQIGLYSIYPKIDDQHLNLISKYVIFSLRVHLFSFPSTSLFLLLEYYFCLLALALVFVRL
jgi:hypothetical protein